MTTVGFTTTDGVASHGDLAVPTEPRAVAIVCHPHPLHGGDRFHPVVTALHEVLPTIGVASLRFDFRADFDGGAGERLNARAALDEVTRRVGRMATFALGYSFGAMVVLGLDHHDLEGIVLVAPPLGRAELPDSSPAGTGALVVVAEHDRFAPPDVVAPITSTWPDTTVEVVESADHFLTGRGAEVASRTAEWVAGRLPPAGLSGRGPRRSRPSRRRRASG